MAEGFERIHRTNLIEGRVAAGVHRRRSKQLRHRRYRNLHREGDLAPALSAVQMTRQNGETVEIPGYWLGHCRRSVVYSAGGVLQRFAQDLEGAVAQEASMAYTPQIVRRSAYIRGGTSKGVFFNKADLPDHAKEPGEAWKNCSRVIGSPDPHGKHTDGMGGTSSTKD